MKTFPLRSHYRARQIHWCFPDECNLPNAVLSDSKIPSSIVGSSGGLGYLSIYLNVRLKKSTISGLRVLCMASRIEPLWILSGFACRLSQCIRKAGYEGKMSGTLDEDILCFSCQRLREPLRVILHRSKVITLCAIYADWDGEIR